jgi:large subunit ribosomal protein L30
MADSLKITYVRSVSGHPKTQAATLQALGLRKLHQTVEKPDNPRIRGMIFKVCHLLEVEEVNS